MSVRSLAEVEIKDGGAELQWEFLHELIIVFLQ